MIPNRLVYIAEECTPGPLLRRSVFAHGNSIAIPNASSTTVFDPKAVVPCMIGGSLWLHAACADYFKDPTLKEVPCYSNYHHWGIRFNYGPNAEFASISGQGVYTFVADPKTHTVNIQVVTELIPLDLSMPLFTISLKPLAACPLIYAREPSVDAYNELNKSIWYPKTEWCQLSEAVGRSIATSHSDGRMELSPYPTN